MVFQIAAGMARRGCTSHIWVSLLLSLYLSLWTNGATSATPLHCSPPLSLQLLKTVGCAKVERFAPPLSDYDDVAVMIALLAYLFLI